MLILVWPHIQSSYTVRVVIGCVPMLKLCCERLLARTCGHSGGYYVRIENCVIKLRSTSRV